jgi:hypothetical protein
MRRAEILRGELRFPEQIKRLVSGESVLVGDFGPVPWVNSFTKGLTSEQSELIDDFWSVLWANFLREKGTSTLLWMNRFGEEFFNRLLYHLSKSGWLTSVVESNYAHIELNESKILKWVSRDELYDIRFKHKFNHYLMIADVSCVDNLVKVNDGYSETGLVRRGFCKAGNNLFSYDTGYLRRYQRLITSNALKDIVGSTKDVSYRDVVDMIIEYCEVVDSEYTLGRSISDSRGRAIYKCTEKVFNPIGSKDARSLLVCPVRPLSDSGLLSVYSFVATLLGCKAYNRREKIAMGEEAVRSRRLPDEGGKHLHNRIWLERIYSNLLNPAEWCVPIELDSTASMLQIIGVLTNDHEYLAGTNLIGDRLRDVWLVDGISREHVKKSMQPILYGSSALPNELWDKAKLSYGVKEFNIISRELNEGRFLNAKRFKDFIIENVEPRRKMRIRIWRNEFIVLCNKFRWEAGEHVVTPVYTTRFGIKTVSRIVYLQPDLEQFKRYFVTLLIHNLDSQIADIISYKMDWVLPNHDAFILHPNDAELLGKMYVDIMMSIYLSRRDILREYFRSIGITGEYRDVDTQQIGEFSSAALK